MGIMVYSLLWVMQDFVHQPNHVRQALCFEAKEFVSGGHEEKLSKHPFSRAPLCRRLTLS